METNPKHELAKLVMNAVVATSHLSDEQRVALGREMAAARLRAEAKGRALREGRPMSHLRAR